MATLAQVGDFCPNQDCPDYGKTDPNSIIKFGKTRQNKQRFRCKNCGQSFNENHGTIFYRKRKAEKDLLEVLALLAEGSRISSISRTKGLNTILAWTILAWTILAWTILAWLREAARHAEALEEILMKDYAIERGQLDGLWSYLANKGQKNTMRKPTKQANFGVQR